MAICKKFVLVRWIEEDSVDVVTTEAVHKEDAASLAVRADPWSGSSGTQHTTMLSGKPTLHFNINFMMWQPAMR